jgi:cytochrome c oxidase cbb3-type subunit 2
LTRVGLLLLAAAALFGVLYAAGPAQMSDEGEAAPEATAPDDPSESLRYRKWETNPPGAISDYNRRTNLAQRGHDVYLKYCVGCHGENGDGQGPAAVRLQTKPRDFTSGIYKFRSTDSGSLPMESDIYRTINSGLARVSMPAFPLIPEAEKIAVIEYLKTFYARWEDEKGQRVVVPVPSAPGDLGDPERILRGRVVYMEMQCNQCHGIDGRGTGVTRTEYIDAWGNEQKPFNFTRGSLKGGNDAEDIYRTFHTGLRSIMPSYGGETLAGATVQSFEARRGTISEEEFERLSAVLDQFPASPDVVYTEMTVRDRLELAERNSWDLVAYIQSLRTTISTADAVFGPNRTSLEERND